MNPILDDMRALFTGLNTLSAKYAARGIESHLYFWLNPFWIVAPKAAQGTALEEYRGTNTRPIVDGKTLDVKNDACGVNSRYSNTKLQPLWCEL